MVLKGIFLMVVLACFNSLSGQSHYLLSRLEVTRHDNRIILTWTIKQGGSCFGIGIFRSTDNTEFEKIGEISGNCGSAEEDLAYTFIDEKPVKNKINQYVLEMGFSGKTAPPLEIEYFEFDKNSSKVIPNPITTSGKVLFINPNNTRHTLSILDLNGKILKVISTESDHFKLSDEIFDIIHPVSSNQYFYLISDEKGKRVSSGHFIVL